MIGLVVLDVEAILIAGFLVLIVLVAGLRPYRGGYFVLVWMLVFLLLAFLLSALFGMTTLTVP